jgi:hypothetical protein
VTAIEDVEGVLVALFDDSGSETGADALDDKMDGVVSGEPSMSMGSRGSNSSPREIKSSLSSDPSAAFSADAVAAVDAGGLVVMVGLG